MIRCVEARQVLDIDISRVVTEYRAQILEDDDGHRFVASFPNDMTKAAQYGTGLKAHCVMITGSPTTVSTVPKRYATPIT
jgi:transposase